MSAPPDSRPREFVVALVLYALVAAAFFGASFPPGRLFVPMHTERLEPWRSELAPERSRELAAGELAGASDKLISFRADDQITVDALGRGQLPLWNPANAGGVPHLAQGLYGVFYPFHALYLWLTPERAYGFLAALHHLLAALFTYLYLRQLGVGFGGALFGGLAFGFSLGLLARAHYYQYVETFAWLPLGLLLVERWFDRRTFWPPLGLAVVTALVLLPGFPQTASYTLWLWVLAALFRAVPLDLDVDRQRALGAILVVLAGATALAPFLDDPRLALAFGPWLALLFAFVHGRRKLRFLCRMGALGIALCLGAGIALLQYLPAVEWMEHGVRSLGVPELQTANGLKPAFLLQALFPNVFGAPGAPLTESLMNLPRLAALSPERIASIGHHGNLIENALYFGVSGALLAVHGAFLGGRGRGFLVTAGLVCIAFAVGVRLAVWPLYFGGFFVGTDPRRALVPAVFAGCCLAARALSARPRPAGPWFAAVIGGALFLPMAFVPDESLTAPVLERIAALGRALGSAFQPDAEATAALAATLRSELARAALFAFGLAAALLVARTPRGRGIGVGAAVLLLGADLFTAARPYLGTQPAAGFLGGHPVIDHLRRELADGGRFAHYAGGVEPSLLHTAVPPNLAGAYGIEDAWCYTVSPPRRWLTLALRGLGFPEGTPLGVYLPPLTEPRQLASRVLDLMCVRLVVGFGRPPSDLPLFVTHEAQYGSAWVMRNHDALPRAFAVGRVLDGNVAGDDAILERLVGGPFDPKAEVFLQGDLAGIPALAAEGTLPHATLLPRERPERIAVDLEGGDRPGILVLADSFAPGWKARVDGAEARVLRANYAFRGVAFPAGARRVELSYESKGVRYGGLASAGSLALLLIGAGLSAGARARARGRGTLA